MPQNMIPWIWTVIWPCNNPLIPVSHSTWSSTRGNHVLWSSVAHLMKNHLKWKYNWLDKCIFGDLRNLSKKLLLCILGKERGSKTFICHLACESKRTRKIRKKKKNIWNRAIISTFIEKKLWKHFLTSLVRCSYRQKRLVSCLFQRASATPSL